MNDSEKTVYIKEVVSQDNMTDTPSVTIFDGRESPMVLSLNGEREALYFGRGAENDIVLHSPLVSMTHGRFVRRRGQWFVEDRAVYGDKPSTNGLIFNDASIYSRKLSDGDLIRIDNGRESIPDGVLFLVSRSSSENKWRRVSLAEKKEYLIGRSKDCDIILPHISVSKHHARIVQDGRRRMIVDEQSTNGVLVNGIQVNGRQELHEKDVIVITNSKLIYTSSCLFYCCYQNGISVDAENVVIKRGKGKKAQITTNDVTVNIKPGELVSIIGGSGAGKSTILNCMCGYLPPASGNVYINGVNLYENFNALKKVIGYVPQTDIVYDNLTLHDMLLYAAKLRLPRDTSPSEYKEAIQRAIALVELEEKEYSFIRALSGGQKKRASIAVELLSDPNLLFLDEPASGLDPGTERSLMNSLRKMADAGKTVILVTHSTLQLKMCDKIAFMGRGGNLCFFGDYDAALQFFGVSDIVDVYRLITEDAPRWRKKYDRWTEANQAPPRQSVKLKHRRSDRKLQLPVLCLRYMRLILNDRQRLLLLLLQAPLLAALIALVADGEQFKQYEMTKSLLFALACSAFWVGMLNAIQEICKERHIVKREYMTGLSLNAYLFSKIIVLGVLCLIQSALIVGVFAWLVGLPEEGLIINPFAETLVTTFISAVASTAMGLFVSSLFHNADRAMTLAPILLMPQILFSGLIFKLNGATEYISWFAVCRWSMEAFGTTANLNALELKQQAEGLAIPHPAEDFFTYTAEHLMDSWIILGVFIIAFLFLSRLALRNMKK